MKVKYEKPKLEINYLSEQDLITTSQEPVLGDGWVKDPFTED